MAAHKHPAEIAQAIALREAGFSLQAINERTGVPIRTLQTHFKASGTKKGKLKQEAIEEARRAVIKDVLASGNVRDQIAMLIHDDLAQVRAIRDRVTVALENLEAEDLRGAALVMRAAAAASVTLKNTSDVLRHHFTPREETTSEDLPELVIYKMTDDEIAEIRRSQEVTEAFDVSD